MIFQTRSESENRKKPRSIMDDSQTAVLQDNVSSLEQRLIRVERTNKRLEVALQKKNFSTLLSRIGVNGQTRRTGRRTRQGNVNESHFDSVMTTTSTVYGGDSLMYSPRSSPSNSRRVLSMPPPSKVNSTTSKMRVPRNIVLPPMPALVPASPSPKSKEVENDVTAAQDSNV